MLNAKEDQAITRLKNDLKNIDVLPGQSASLQRGEKLPLLPLSACRRQFPEVNVYEIPLKSLVEKKIF